VLVLTALCGLGAAACGGRAEVGPGGPGNESDGGVTSDDGGIVGEDGGVVPLGDAGRRPDGSTGVDAGRPVDGGVSLTDSGAPFDSGVFIDAGGCQTGFHMCSGRCVDDTAPATCGGSCTPCAAPSNGVASCNGVSCQVTCDPGYSACATGCCGCGDVQNDPNNCGSCGHSCGGEACVDGVCGSTVVATGQANAYAIAADDVNVYWTTTGAASAVLQAPVGGGGATVLFSSPNDFPAALAVLQGQVYFTDEIQPGSVSRVPIGGGAYVPVASNLDYPGALVASGGSLFFTLNDFTSQTGGSIASTPAQGGTLTTISGSQSFGQQPSLAIADGNAYWTTYSDVVSAPLAGGTQTTLASQVYATAVAADAVNVYYGSTLSGGVVVQQPAHGGAAITIATGQYYPNAVATDDTSIYWTTGQGAAGTVMRAPIGGGTPVTLAANQADPSGLALNSKSLFWVDFGDGSIKSVPK
jgi:hypothetical protein